MVQPVSAVELHVSDGALTGDRKFHSRCRRNTVQSWLLSLAGGQCTAALEQR